MKIFTLLFVLLTLVLFSCNNSGREEKTESQLPVETQKNVVQVVDFHTEHRCETCLTIETKTKATLTNYFGVEMEKGTITFETVNVDEKENKAMAEEFAAFGTALFINVLDDQGSSTKIDLTNFAFMNAINDDSTFEDGLVEELNKALKLL